MSHVITMEHRTQKEASTRGISERTWTTHRKALTYLAVFALAIPALYAVVYGRLLGEAPLHGITNAMQRTQNFAWQLQLRRPFPAQPPESVACPPVPECIACSPVPESIACPPVPECDACPPVPESIACPPVTPDASAAKQPVCPTAKPDASEPLSGLLAPPLVWSRGYYDLMRMDNGHVPMSYFMRGTTSLAAPGSLAEDFGELQGWVWVRTGTRPGEPNDTEQFARTVLPNISRPIQLISSDGHSSIPSQLAPGVADAILNHPQVKVWYTQNYDGSLTHPKLKLLPIGLNLHFNPELKVHDNHWDTKLAELLKVAAKAPPPAERSATVLCDVLAITHPDRRAMKDVLQNVSHVDFTTERVNFATAMRTYSQYRFATSPRGKGIDCHRTWELLTLRTIPIVLTSSLDPLYKGLPVVIVQAWEEVADPGNLQRWYDEHALKLQLSGTTWLNRNRWLKNF